MIISVLVEVASQNIDRLFDYKVPNSLISKIKIGIRVIVPFGNRQVEGFIMKIKQTSEIEDLKDINNVVDEEVVLNEELLKLGKYRSRKYLSNLINCYQIMLRSALKAKNKTNINIKTEKYIILNKEISNIKTNPSQQKIIDILNKEKEVKKSLLNTISQSSLKTLLKNKIVKEIEKELYRLTNEIKTKPKSTLTADQEKVVAEVIKNKKLPQTYLLHGVTGSGKTEVYMEIIEKNLLNQKTALVLLPEISLTPQIVERFRERFGNKIAILHSGLNAGEKYDEWRRIRNEEVNIVIGARSAIFAPLKNIGVIIIDEEHSTTYKENANPHYHAVDIAIQRSQFHQSIIILGSATPSLESYARAQKKVYQLLELPNRIFNREMPKITIIDMNKKLKQKNSYFSDDLVTKMQKVLARDEQIILLLNRRGYASFITCFDCGHVEKCPKCEITLTYHKTSNNLRCHYCGYATKKSETCPTCHSLNFKKLGLGTEKIEEELNNLFSKYKIIRMDLDTTTKKGSHERIINDFKAKKYHILLGTQMISKGLDFDNVTLVGVINADTSLNIPDFRSSEYTFSLLNQVSGRSGRGKKRGSVIIQTFNPDHYAIMFAKNNDFKGFYQQEMFIRGKLGYPPYYYLVSIKIMSASCDVAKEISNKISYILKEDLINSIILGPTIPNVFKINNIYRFNIIIKYKHELNLYPTLIKIKNHYKSNNKVKIDIDFNPIGL